MGVNLTDIVPSEPISFEELQRKTIAIDAMNTLYQFLSSIRQPDGTPLMDSQGRVTSHLTGLFYRTIRLLEAEIKPIYVFDGTPPKQKNREITKRKKAKKEAREEWKKAIKEKRIEDARKYAQRTSTFSEEMIKDSKRLLDCMGLPYVQAPSEGEAQCVTLCNKKDAWAVGSQDYDSLLHGAEHLVRGLTGSGKTEPSIIKLKKVTDTLEITREQLIDIAILIGTDYNPGVKGIGPKKALKKIKENKLDEGELDFDINEIRQLFLKPQVTEDYKIEWKTPDKDKLKEFLCEERDFSESRIEKGYENLENALKELTQKDLTAWF